MILASRFASSVFIVLPEPCPLSDRVSVPRELFCNNSPRLYSSISTVVLKAIVSLFLTLPFIVATPWVVVIFAVVVISLRVPFALATALILAGRFILKESVAINFDISPLVVVALILGRLKYRLSTELRFLRFPLDCKAVFPHCSVSLGIVKSARLPEALRTPVIGFEPNVCRYSLVRNDG